MGFTFTVNGEEVTAEKNVPLLRFLRDELKLYSVKDGCSEGACGTCTIIVDGRAIKSCVLTTQRAVGKNIITVEGLSIEEKEAFVYAFGSNGSVQCGFCIPGMVMSGKALIDKNPDPTEEEVKRAIRGNICRCTGYKKIIAGIMSAAAILRGEQQIDDLEKGEKYGIGDSAFRVDVRRKALGYGKYPDDIGSEYFVHENSELAKELAGRFPGENVHLKPGTVVPYENDLGCSEYLIVPDDMPDMVYASAVRTKHPRARVVKINSAAAESLPGVIGILTAADVPHNKVGHIQPDWDVMIAEGDITRDMGDVICVVTAETPFILEKAKKLVKVEYEVLEPVRNIEEAMAPDAPKIHEGGNLCQKRHVTRGDAKTALENSAYTASGRFYTPFTDHAFLEPECVVTVPYKDGVKVLSTDQGAFATQHEIMHMMDWGEHPERVVVENQLIGGGFGGKEDVSVQHLAFLAAYKYGRPVKMKFSRQESIYFHPKRHAMMGDFTLGCDKDGYFTGLDCDIYFDTGAYASLCGPVLERACTHSVGPYTYQNTDIRGYGYYTNNPPGGAFRGFGVCQSEFALESLINELAKKAGISAWEIRYKNAIEPGKELPNGQIADTSTAMKEALEAVKPYFDANEGRAGISCAMKNAGTGVGLPDAGRARICIENGVAVIYSAASDIGQGCLTVFCQAVSEATGLPLSHIRNGFSNTENAPDSGTTSGSRQTLLTGEAVRGAAFLLRDAMLAAQIAGERADGSTYAEVLKEASGYISPRKSKQTQAEYGIGSEFAPTPDDLGFVSPAFEFDEKGTITAGGTGLNQGTYGRKGTQTPIAGSPVADIDRMLAELEGQSFFYEYFEPTDKLGADRPNPKSHVAYGYAANVVVLEDDGRIKDIYAAYDAGKVVNPISIQGQIEGGVLMSMGYGLTEDFPLKDCVPQAKYGTLGLLRADQIPDIHAMYVEKDVLLGVAYGAKGIGEITTIPAAPAIGGAYYALDGKMRYRLPMEDTYYSRKK